MRRAEYNALVNEIRKDQCGRIMSRARGFLEPTTSQAKLDFVMEMCIELSEMSAEITKQTLEKLGLVELED